MTDISHDAYIARAAICEAAAFLSAPHTRMKPRIFPDGNMWCALYGEDLQEGIAGFGETPAAACADFDKNWNTQTLRAACRAKESAAAPTVGTPDDAYAAAFERYIRTGDIGALPPKTFGEEMSGYPVPARWALRADEYMAQRGERRGASDNRSVYVNLAAMLTLLDDRSVNIAKWLAEESAEAFHATAAEGVEYDAGTILRDPYSAKPYVLFYWTRNAQRIVSPQARDAGEVT